LPVAFAPLSDGSSPWPWPTVGFAIVSVVVLPRSRGIVAAVWPDYPPDYPIDALKPVCRLQDRTMAIQVYDRAFRHEATHLTGFGTYIELVTALPNDDVLVHSVPGPAFVFRPSDGRRRPIVPHLGSYAIAWLPLCAHLADDRRRRIATAFAVAQVPLVLVDLVCDYVTVDAGGGGLE
jgi:hypothetical protein